jgi:Sec-independent protein translocase protein TatA
MRFAALKIIVGTVLIVIGLGPESMPKLLQYAALALGAFLTSQTFIEIGKREGLMKNSKNEQTKQTILKEEL